MIDLALRSLVLCLPFLGCPLWLRLHSATLFFAPRSVLLLLLLPGGGPGVLVIGLSLLAASPFFIPHPGGFPLEPPSLGCL